MVLWIYLFLIVFINGFEAGGYQASLYSIGQTYDLSVTSKGLFASVELFATMLAPLVLGNWADRTKKLRCLLILLGIQIIFSITIFMSNIQLVFIVGIFFLGLTTSALQFISIAALAESYPVSGKKKIGFMTSMYALGAFLAPLFVDFFINSGLTWKMLFLSLTIGSIIAFAGVVMCQNQKAETVLRGDNINAGNTGFVVWGVLLLCVVMCIYVGFENGFAFFVDTLFEEVFSSGLGKFALSMFWVVMIPSRVLVGLFAKYSRKILIAAIIAIPLITVIIAFANSAELAMALCIPLGFACGAIYPSVLTTLMEYSGDRKATATAMITTATGIGGAAFTALTGILAGSMGLRGAMIALSAFFILSLISVVVLGRINIWKNKSAE